MQKKTSFIDQELSTIVSSNTHEIDQADVTVEKKQNNHFSGELQVGDEFYFSNNPDLTFIANLDHDYTLNVHDDGSSFIEVFLHFFKERGTVQFNEDGSWHEGPSTFVTDRIELYCNSSSFSFFANGEGEFINTLSEGYFGEAFTIDHGREHVIVFCIDRAAKNSSSIKQMILNVLA